MRSRTRFAFAAGCVGLALLIEPAAGTPLPQPRHAPHAQHPRHVRPAQRTAALAPHPPTEVSLSAHTSYAVPALVSEARKYMGTNPTDRKRLWCATFMNFVLAKVGYAGTNSDAARSFAYYGRRISQPRVGAIAVLTRGKHGGHVGVVSGIDKNGDPIIISGNHNRLVGEGLYSRSRVIAYVMPTERHGETRIAANGPAGDAGADGGVDSPISELIAAIEAEQAHAETPAVTHVARLAPRRAEPAPVPHRLVQQTPGTARQAQPVSRAVGNPFSELIGRLEGRKRKAL
jgi:uncharacterized protein (TIGR02594 family)